MFVRQTSLMERDDAMWLKYYSFVHEFEAEINLVIDITGHM